MLLPDLNRRNSRLRQFITWTLVILVIALIFGGKPLYHEFKHRRANSLAQQGDLLVNEKQANAAVDKYRAALEIDPASVHANYGMARLLTAARMADAFSHWNVVFGENGGNDGDRLEAARLAIFFKRDELVGKYLNPVLAHSPVPLEAVRLAAIFADAQHQEAEVLRFARAYLQNKPDDGGMSLMLARHLQASPDPQAVKEAKPLLWTALRGGGENVPEALQRLAIQPDLATNEVRELLTNLTKFPTNDATQMLKMQLEARLTPQAKDEVTAKVLAESSQSPEKFLIACRWLSQQGLYADLLQILNGDKALQLPELFQIYTDAMSRSGRWNELDGFLNKGPLPIDPMQSAVFRARTAMQLGDGPRAQLRWQEALTLAGSNPDMLKYIGAYAEAVGAGDRALQAYQVLVKDPKFSRVAYEGMIRVAERQGDTPGLRKLMRTMAELYPEDPAPQNDLAYLSLLLNDNVPASREIAEKLVHDSPQLPAYRATLALARLRSNDPAGALKAYDGIKFYVADSLPSWIAVYVATIGANGQAENARALAQTIPLDRLKPEERRLIQQWLPPAHAPAPVPTTKP